MVRETVHRVASFDQDADHLWSVARGFAAPWHPWIDWMEQEPAKDGRIVRRFGVKGEDGVMREQLTYLSHSYRTLAYRALSGIEGAQGYAARLKLTAEDRQTTATWHAEIDAAAPRASEIASGTAAVFDAGLAALPEAEPSPLPPIPNLRTSTPTTRTLGSVPRLGLTVALEGTGQADTLCLFLHGIGGNRSNWDAQLKALGALMPMAALDLRGYGDSTLGFGQSHLDDYFDDILAVMAAFEAKHLVLCGLSYGAWIAASFALRHPDKIAALILCGGCTGMSEAAPDEREAFRISRQVPLDAGQTPADFAPAVVDVIAGPDATAEVRAALTTSMAAIPTETYRDALTCFTTPLERLDFSRATFPVLLMTGEYDRLAPADEIRSVSHRFADGGAPFVQFEEIPNAGHVCNLEQPDAVNAHIARFLMMTGIAPDPQTPKQTRKAEKRIRILEAALVEFSHNGYSGASMQAIAERAGVSKPTLYQYIGQKEDMFRAVLDQGRETILAPFASADKQDMVAVLWDFAQSYAGFVLAPANLAIARLMIGEAERVPDIVKAFQKTGPERALNGIAAYLQARADERALLISDSHTAAEHLWSLILSGPRNHALHFPQDIPDRSALDASIESGLRVFLRAYASDPAATLSALDHIVTDRR